MGLKKTKKYYRKIKMDVTTLRVALRKRKSHDECSYRKQLIIQYGKRIYQNRGN